MKINQETGEVTFTAQEMYVIIQSYENSLLGEMADVIVGEKMLGSLVNANYNLDKWFDPRTAIVEDTFKLAE